MRCREGRCIQDEWIHYPLPSLDRDFLMLEFDLRLARACRDCGDASRPEIAAFTQSNISTVRATSPAFMARNASFTSLSRLRRVIISSSISRP